MMTSMTNLSFRKTQAKGREASRHQVLRDGRQIGVVALTPDSSKTGGLWSARRAGVVLATGFATRTDAAAALSARVSA